MGRNIDLVGQIQEEHNAPLGYEEGSEEEEPYECEFHDDDPEDVDPCEDLIPKQDEANEEEPHGGSALPENEDASDEEPFEVELCSDESISEHDSFHSEPCTSLVSSGHTICRKRPYEVEWHHDLMSDKDALVENNSKYVQPLKKEQNMQDLKQAPRYNNYLQEEVLVAKEKETKPFKKRLSVKFAADVSCYTYNAESFAVAKFDKTKAQVDDQEKQLCSRPEQSASMSQNGGRLEEGDCTNLFVGNLPSSVASHKLIELFLPFGRIVRSRVVDDCYTGLSKGYGFVTYADPHSAIEAIKRMNGRMVEGKMLEVRVADAPSRGSNPYVQSASMTDRQPTKESEMNNLYVSNLPLNMKTDMLRDLFVPYGQVTSAKVVRDYTTGLSKGYGFVKYSEPRDAAYAVIQLNGCLFEGKKIEVRVCGIPLRPSSSLVESHASNRTMKEIDMSNLGKRPVVKRSLPCPTRAEDQSLSVSGSNAMREIDMANLYVGGVPLTVTCDQLVELFRPFGQIVQARKLQSHGYGLVRYANPSSAAAAIDHMHGYQIGGSTLAVRVAGLPGESNATKNTQGVQTVDGNRQKQIDMTNLYVCHLPPYVTTEKLIELFLPCGQITQAKVVVDKVTGVSKGFGFVKFADAYSAAVAITHMNGYPLEGHVLEVRIANVPRSDMISYMAHFYSHFTSLDPSRMAVGVPTSYWPYYYAEPTYATQTEYQGQGAESATATAADQTSQQDGLPGSNSVGSIAEKDIPCVSNPIASDHSQLESWTGPPGFGPHVVRKEGSIVTNPPRPHSKSTGWAGPPGFEPHAVKKEPMC